MERPDKITILRCCRDWPCHTLEAVYKSGRCGICRQVPEIVHEEYPESMYARNREKN